MTENALYIKVAGVEKYYDGLGSVGALLRALGMSKSNQKKYALKGIDLEIHEGERIGIIGENGAGKSTLLKIIAGTVSQSHGTVDVNGDVHAVLTLGVGLREELTGRENLYLDAEAHGRSRKTIEPLIEEMIEFSGLGDFIDRPVKTYSSGMKSRLVFSSLVFVEPEILILDETLSTGDQWFQAKAKMALKRLCDKGKIVIIVSHSMQAIHEMCSRCIWVSDGAILDDGKPEDVIAKYVEWQDARIQMRLTHSQNLQKHWVRSENIDIVAMRILDSSERAERAIFQTGKGVLIEVDLKLCAELWKPKLVLEIKRADGLVVLEKELLLEIDNANNRLLIEGEISSLRLTSGLFECSVGLCDGSKVLALRSCAMKVSSDELPKGGHPLFLYPSQVVSEGQA